MGEEFKLSERIVKSYLDDVGNWTYDNIKLEDVKEFIRRVKENMKEGTFNLRQSLEEIDKRAGEELVR